MRLFTAIIILIAGLVGISAAQEQSLGEAARQARQAKKPSNSNVIDNDAIARKQGPIPDITLRGPENCDELVAAIDEYRQKHPHTEFEAVLHEWYDRHDEKLARIYRDRAIARRLQRDRYAWYSESYRDGDYDKYREVQRMEALNAYVDNDIAEDTSMAAGRLQQSLNKVRSHLQSVQLKFQWFKVRYSNGSY